MSHDGHAFFFFLYTYNTMRLKNSLKKLVPSKKVAIGLVIGIALLVAMYMMMRPQKKEHLSSRCRISDPLKNEYTTRVETYRTAGDWHCPDGWIDTGCDWSDGTKYATKQCRRQLGVRTPGECRLGDPLANLYWIKGSGKDNNGVPKCFKNTVDTKCELLKSPVRQNVNGINELRMGQCRIPIINWMKLYPNLFRFTGNGVLVENVRGLNKKWGKQNLPKGLVKMLEILRDERPEFNYTNQDNGFGQQVPVTLNNPNRTWPLKVLMLRLLDLKEDGVTPVDGEKIDLERQWAHWLKYARRGTEPQYQKTDYGKYAITGWQGPPVEYTSTAAAQVNYNNPSGSSFGMGRL